MTRAPGHPFVYHAPTPEQVERIRLVREVLRTAHELECSMWANKAIVLHGELGDADMAALPR